MSNGEGYTEDSAPHASGLTYSRIASIIGQLLARVGREGPWGWAGINKRSAKMADEVNGSRAKLTGKQRLFVEAYLECWNATEAARRAEYQGNENTLGSVGWENMQKPAIAAAISRRLSEKAMSADEVLMRLANMARGDISEFIQDYGAIDWKAVKEKGHLVKKVSHTQGKQSSIELYDAQAALEKIGRGHGLFVDRQKHEYVGDITIRIVRNGTDGKPSPTP